MQVCNLNTVYQYIKNGFWSSLTTANYTSYDLLGFCTDYDSILKNLLPGMNCTYDYQCTTKFCDSGTCKGGYAGDPCISNMDCSPNYYC